jgi:hypothetical protein
MSFFEQLERDLVGAARRRRDARRAALAVRLRERIGLRRFALVTLLFPLVGSATAGATLYALRGSVIPAPSARDVQHGQLANPTTTHLAGVTAADPAPARPLWTMRLARSSTGLLCSTVGQLDDGRFGLVGLDGRFRAYAPRIVDSCGEQVSGEHPSLIGARVFDADDPHEVRTVINGVGGERLRSVTVEAGGRRHTVPVGPDGTFLYVLSGYPEDSGAAVALRYADGHVEQHAFGRSALVVPDPSGVQAWKTSAFVVSGDRRTCVAFMLARPSGPSAGASSPAACGLFASQRHPTGYYFAVRRLAPGPRPRIRDMSMLGDWNGHAPRTAVWGGVGDDVAAVEIRGPNNVAARPRIAVSNTFLAVFRGTVDPASLTVTVRFRDGRVVHRHGSANLVTRKVPTR